MFMMVKDPTFSWPVTVHVPGDGARIAQTFTGLFRVVPATRAAALLAEQRSAAALFREVLIGWQGIVDERREPVPFSEETREALLDHGYILVALSEAYADALSGRAAEKN